MKQSMTLPQRVQQSMKNYSMIQAESRILVALSGGGDSVCLLCVLKTLQKEMGFVLEALHVEHGIRAEEAQEDARFCQELCQKLEIPCHVVCADVPALAAEHKMSLEETARKVRYEVLEQQRQKMQEEGIRAGHQDSHAVIAVAHHQEDQAETVLWNLLRGAGLKGLAGMEPVHGHVIRPLLEVGKKEILEYLTSQEMLWRQDSTNDSDDYTRNRIRHHMLTYAREQLNVQSAEHICQAAKVAAQADGYLRRQAEGWIREKGKEGKIPVSQLLAEEEILQTYVLRHLLQGQGGLTDVTTRHVELVRSLLADMPGSSAQRQVDLSSGRRVRRSYDLLWVETKREKTIKACEELVVDLKALDLWERGSEEEPVWIQWNGERYGFRVIPAEKEQKFPPKQYTKWMDCDKIETTLVFRTRQPGDYITLAGGGRKTVKSYMIDEKIPAEQRDRIPVIAQGSHVLWIPGYRLNDSITVSKETKTILEITRYGG